MKPVHFVASSLDDLRAFPDAARSEAGYAIYLAQCGDKAVTACPMVGFGGAKVLEVVINEDGDTYRAVYTVRFRSAVYVLDAFQKKSKRGDKTPMIDIRRLRQRLASAEQDHAKRYEQQQQTTKEHTHERGA